MTWSALTNLPRHKIYVLRGLSVENFITANLKIQSAESWTFRLRFAANFKIQFWIPKIAPKIRSEIPVFRPRAPCKLQYLLTISRFRVLNTGNLHGARSKFSIFRRAWILKLSESRLGFFTRIQSVSEFWIMHAWSDLNPIMHACRSWMQKPPCSHPEISSVPKPPIAAMVPRRL